MFVCFMQIIVPHYRCAFLPILTGSTNHMFNNMQFKYAKPVVTTFGKALQQFHHHIMTAKLIKGFLKTN